MTSDKDQIYKNQWNAFQIEEKSQHSLISSRSSHSKFSINSKAETATAAYFLFFGWYFAFLQNKTKEF